MNSSTNALHLAPAIGAPTGRLARIGAAVWHALEAIGRARAERELRLAASRWERFDPELARHLRVAPRELHS